jgi:hypothetical protein
MNVPMAFIEELHEEEAQSFREMVEEATKVPPYKRKKKMKGKDEARKKRILAQERTPSLIALSMGEIETSVGSSILSQF